MPATGSVRPETERDVAAIHHVNTAAFGRAGEAELVHRLRAHEQIVLSLVAVLDQQIVGHILFSPVTIVGGYGSHAAVGLGPLAVLPQHQRHGIGSRLVQRGLDLLHQQNHALVVVLGDPQFYGRFGFRTAASFGIRSEFTVPNEMFMLAELVPGAAQGKHGTVIYAPEFSAL